MQARAPLGRLVARRSISIASLPDPHLAEEQRIDDLRGFDQFRQHAAVGVRHLREIAVMSVGAKRAAICCSVMGIGHASLLSADERRGAYDQPDACTDPLRRSHLP
jgi:hypothetical protein